MGLDDMGESARQSKDEEETEQLKEELGVEDKDDLERLEKRTQTQSKIEMALDSRVEELEKEVKVLRKALAAVIEELDDSDSTNDDDSDEIWL
jgi:uncharacterized coiled-coil protein SlyX